MLVWAWRRGAPTRTRTLTALAVSKTTAAAAAAAASLLLLLPAVLSSSCSSSISKAAAHHRPYSSTAAFLVGPSTAAARMTRLTSRRLTAAVASVTTTTVAGRRRSTRLTVATATISSSSSGAGDAMEDAPNPIGEEERVAVPTRGAKRGRPAKPKGKAEAEEEAEAVAKPTKRTRRAAAAVDAGAAESPTEVEVSPAAKATANSRRRARRSSKESVADGEGSDPSAPNTPEPPAVKEVKAAARKAAAGTGGKGKVKSKKAAADGGDDEDSEAPSLDTSWEKRLEAKGLRFVYGVDEAGRGPLAGPVVAAACFIPSDVVIPGIQDSKAMDEAAREKAYAAILAAEDRGVRWAVQVVDHARIDEINILQATMEAMRGALTSKIDAHGPSDAADSYALIDGNRIPSDLPASIAGADCVVKGDSKVRCIAAASILAKVTRDRIMLEYHAQYPQYDFAQHKGYPTPAHKAAIVRHGPCPIHRMTFAPIRKK